MLKLFKYIFIFLLAVNATGQSYSDSIKNEFKQALISNQLSTQKKLSKQILNLYSTNTILYYQYLLTNVPSQSIIITNGVNDTYPLIALQHSRQLNSKVKIVSLSLLKHLQYKQQKEKELLIQLSTTPQNNIKLLMQRYKVFVSSTVNYKYYKSKANHLFVTGLFLESNCNNQLEKLNLFWRDIKRKGTINLKLNSSDKKLYQNYLPPLITLYKLYILNNYDTKILKQDILKLAKQTNQTEKVEQILKKYR